MLNVSWSNPAHPSVLVLYPGLMHMEGAFPARSAPLEKCPQSVGGVVAVSTPSSQDSNVGGAAPSRLPL